MKQLKMRHLDRLGSSVIPSIGEERLADPKASGERGAVAGAFPPSSRVGGLVAGPGCLITSSAVPEGSGEHWPPTSAEDEARSGA